MRLLAGLLGKAKKGIIESEWVVDIGAKATSQISAGFLDEETIVVGASNGKVYAISSKGSVKWNFSPQKSLSKEQMLFMEDEGLSKIKSMPIIADIDDDGKGEIIFGTEFGMLYVLNHKGQPLWSFKARDAISGSACAADINNDGKLEILFGSSDSNFYAVSNTGKLLWQFPAKSGIESMPSAMREQNQIIFGSNDGTVHALSGTGKLLWEFKSKDKITAQPAFAKLYNDDRLFIVIGSHDNNLYALTQNGKLHWQFQTEGKIFSKAVLADVNNDRKIEAVFGSCDDKLHVVSYTGKKLWDYETNFWVVAAPLVEDFDNDSNFEIAAGSYDGWLYLLEGEGKYALDYMPGISGITMQSGSVAELLTSEAGSYIAKVRSNFKTDGMIIGLDCLRQSKSVIAACDSGKVYKLNWRKI